MEWIPIMGERMCLNSYATSSIVIPEAVIDSARLEEVSVTLQGGITDDQFGGKKKSNTRKLQKYSENFPLKENLQIT